MSTTKKILLAALGLLVLLGGVLILRKSTAKQVATNDRSTNAQGTAPKQAKAYAEPVNAEALYAAEKRLKDFCKKLEAPLPPAVEDTLSEAKGKDLVFVWGGTGSGKSTLIHALYNGSGTIQEKKIKKGITRSRYESILEPTQPIKKGDTLLFQTGAGHKPITQHPEVVEWDGKLLCEGASIGCEREEEKELINYRAMGTLLQQAKSVRVCFLFTEGQIMQPGLRGNYFIGMWNEFLRLFKQGKEVKNLRQHLPKVQLIITKSSGRFTKQEIQGKLDVVLRNSFDLHEELVDTMIENMVLVDAADRAMQFKGAYHDWFWTTHPSQDQTTVEALKQRLLASEPAKEFSPDVFQNPTANDMLSHVRSMCHELSHRVKLAIAQHNVDNAGIVQRALGLLARLKMGNHAADEIVHTHTQEIINDFEEEARRPFHQEDEIIQRLRQDLIKADKKAKEAWQARNS